MSNPSLPTTNKSASREKRTGPENCCCYFAVRHDIPEAGGSRWAPWYLLLATRLISSIILTLFGLLDLAIGLVETIIFKSKIGFVSRSKIFLDFVFLTLGVTYSLLASCTLINARAREVQRKKIFSSIVVLLYGIISPFSVYLINEFLESVMINRKFRGEMLILLIPLFSFMLDVTIMQAKVRFRFRYGFYSCLVYIIYAVLWNISVELHYNRGLKIGFALAFASTMVLSALAAVGLTRISK